MAEKQAGTLHPLGSLLGPVEDGFRGRIFGFPVHRPEYRALV